MKFNPQSSEETGHPKNIMFQNYNRLSRGKPCRSHCRQKLLPVLHFTRFVGHNMAYDTVESIYHAVLNRPSDSVIPRFLLKAGFFLTLNFRRIRKTSWRPKQKPPCFQPKTGGLLLWYRQIAFRLPGEYLPGSNRFPTIRSRWSCSPFPF